MIFDLPKAILKMTNDLEAFLTDTDIDKREFIKRLGWLVALTYGVSLGCGRQVPTSDESASSVEKFAAYPLVKGHIIARDYLAETDRYPGAVAAYNSFIQVKKRSGNHGKSNFAPASQNTMNELLRKSDLDRDGVIGRGDLEIWADNFGNGPSIADINGDNETDIVDGIIIGYFYGEKVPYSSIDLESRLINNETELVIRSNDYLRGRITITNSDGYTIVNNQQLPHMSNTSGSDILQSVTYQYSAVMDLGKIPVGDYEVKISIDGNENPVTQTIRVNPELFSLCLVGRDKGEPLTPTHLPMSHPAQLWKFLRDEGYYNTFSGGKITGTDYSDYLTNYYIYDFDRFPGSLGDITEGPAKKIAQAMKAGDFVYLVVRAHNGRHVYLDTNYEQPEVYGIFINGAAPLGKYSVNIPTHNLRVIQDTCKPDGKVEAEHAIVFAAGKPNEITSVSVSNILANFYREDENTWESITNANIYVTSLTSTNTQRYPNTDVKNHHSKVYYKGGMQNQANSPFLIKRELLGDDIVFFPN